VPADLREERRIKRLGGEVRAARKPGGGSAGTVQTGRLRIWMKGRDMPGITISRSIGDQ
jgi:hypothetical protein